MPHRIASLRGGYSPRTTADLLDLLGPDVLAANGWRKKGVTYDVGPEGATVAARRWIAEVRSIGDGERPRKIGR